MGQAIISTAPVQGPVRDFFYSERLLLDPRIPRRWIAIDAVHAFHDASPVHVVAGIVSSSQANGQNPVPSSWSPNVKRNGSRPFSRWRKEDGAWTAYGVKTSTIRCAWPQPGAARATTTIIEARRGNHFMHETAFLYQGQRYQW